MGSVSPTQAECLRGDGHDPAMGQGAALWAVGLGENLRLLRRELVVGEHALGVELGELLQLIG